MLRLSYSLDPSLTHTHSAFLLKGLGTKLQFSHHRQVLRTMKYAIYCWSHWLFFNNPCTMVTWLVLYQEQIYKWDVVHCWTNTGNFKFNVLLKNGVCALRLVCLQIYWYLKNNYKGRPGNMFSNSVHMPLWVGQVEIFSNTQPFAPGVWLNPQLW